ncbi:MAG: hypothetical protein WC640_00390 [Candidatus Paceibacterota bacterium]|jgi:hypothetical protein
MKNIVLVSNPFGFGPVGKLHSIAAEFLPLAKQGKISLTFAGGESSWEIIKDKNISWLEVNERSEEDLKQLLAKINNPHVISSQNRFVIKVTRDLKLPSAFLDGLAWFWDKIPEDHLLADIIFWVNYPGIEAKVIPKYNIELISGIVPQKSQRKSSEKKLTIIHLGGGVNPLTPILPINWLDILILALKKTETENLFVCGGRELISYLQNNIPPSKINSSTLNHQDFEKKLALARKLVTVGGQSATMEALSLGVPIAFLPSYNLSQAMLVEYLRPRGAAPLRFDWQDLGFPLPMGKEKTAIEIYDSYAKQVKENAWFLTEATDKIQQLIEDELATIGQRNFIKDLGYTGTQEIYNALKKLWSLD